MDDNVELIHGAWPISDHDLARVRQFNLNSEVKLEEVACLYTVRNVLLTAIGHSSWKLTDI